MSDIWQPPALLARVEWWAKSKMMGHIDYGSTFCTEPSISQCLTKSRFFVEIEGRPRYSHGGSNIASACVRALCTFEFVNSWWLWFICLNMSLFWSGIRYFAECPLCRRGDGHYRDITIDFIINFPLGGKLQ